MAEQVNIATSASEELATRSSSGLRVSGVSGGYQIGRGERVVATRNVSLKVERGAFAAVIGPSGCGKSTLLNVIAGLSEPFEGEVAVDGNPAARRLGTVGYMQQKDLLLPWRTVLANARLGLELAGVGKAVAGEAAKKRADEFGLASVVDSYPWQLSGGMRQRAALLRATLPESSVLLLDEPFGALDAITRRHMQHWLASVLDRSERAVLLVTHDIEEALLLADRIYVMSPGPGTISATVDVTLDHPRSDATVTSPEFIELKSRLMAVLSASSGALETLR